MHGVVVDTEEPDAVQTWTLALDVEKRVNLGGLAANQASWAREEALVELEAQGRVAGLAAAFRGRQVGVGEASEEDKWPYRSRTSLPVFASPAARTRTK